MKLTLKAARVRAGLTQKEAAKKVGVNVSTLISYELGRTFPDVKTLKQIEEVYGIGYNDLDFLCE